MWCKRCHNGSEVYKYAKCGQCGSVDMVDKNPLPNKPSRSMRAMDKRKGEDKPKKYEKESNAALHAEVEAVVGTLKGKDYSKGQAV